MKQQRIGLGIALGVALGIAGTVPAQEAVQWRIEDGGNGHWYERFTWSQARAWELAREAALNVGADLAAISSAEEQLWIATELGLAHGSCAGYQGWIIGGYQDFGASDFEEPGQGWRWSNGEVWNWTNWASHAPDNYSGNQHWLMIYEGGVWDDAGLGPGGAEPMCRALLEWSADCNDDGIVDYGQILQGQLVDADSNGVPDICEVDPCPGDITGGGVVDGTDLAALLSAWGTNGQGKFTTDLNDDGTVDAGDLSIVLAGWGPCPN